MLAHSRQSGSATDGPPFVATGRAAFHGLVGHGSLAAFGLDNILRGGMAMAARAAAAAMTVPLLELRVWLLSAVGWLAIWLGHLAIAWVLLLVWP
jgi:hypothetical protein